MERFLNRDCILIDKALFTTTKCITQKDGAEVWAESLFLIRNTSNKLQNNVYVTSCLRRLWYPSAYSWPNLFEAFISLTQGSTSVAAGGVYLIITPESSCYTWGLHLVICALFLAYIHYITVCSFGLVTHWGLHLCSQFCFFTGWKNCLGSLLYRGRWDFPIPASTSINFSPSCHLWHNLMRAQFVWEEAVSIPYIQHHHPDLPCCHLGTRWRPKVLMGLILLLASNLRGGDRCDLYLSLSPSFVQPLFCLWLWCHSP